MRYLLVVFILLLTGCLAPHNNGIYYTRSGAIVHWQPSDFPLEIVVDEALSPDRQTALQEAILLWNTEVGATVFTITRIVDIFSLEEALPPPGTLIVVETDLEDTNPDEFLQGYARLYWTHARLEHVYIAIDFAVVEEEASVVFAHELGHALGLTHDEDHMSLMYRSAVSSWRQIQDDDIAFIRWEMQRGN